MFSSILTVPLNQKFFKETRTDDQTIWVEKTFNRKGTLAEITKLDNNGGLNKLLVPIGDERKGWKAFYNLLNGISTQHQPSTSHNHSTTTFPDHQPTFPDHQPTTAIISPTTVIDHPTYQEVLTKGKQLIAAPP